MFALLVTLLIAAAAGLSWLGSLARLLARFERKAAGGGRLDYY